MGNYGNKAIFVVGAPNPKRQAAKKLRKFGLSFIDPVDKWCQSKDPLFKIKGIKRHSILKRFR